MTTVIIVLSWGFLFFTIGFGVGRDRGHQQAMKFCAKYLRGDKGKT